MPRTHATPAADRRSHGLLAVPFGLAHVVAVAGVFWVGWSWSGFALAIGLYYARMFFITAGYHRYFSHRAYKTSRAFQFLLAFGAQTSAQKGVIWWASHHRTHHKLSDKPGDVHSVLLDGFLWSHVGWIVSRKWEKVDESKVKDLLKYPELRFLDRFHLVPSVALAVVLLLAGGWEALYWGFFVSTTLLWHGTFTINSLSHMFGSRRYATSDSSRNNALLALITLGEGWHNNHHYYQRSARQGFFWWEIDPTYYLLWILEKMRVVSRVHTPPGDVRDGHHVELADPAAAEQGAFEPSAAAAAPAPAPLLRS